MPIKILLVRNNLNIRKMIKDIQLIDLHAYMVDSRDILLV